MAYEQNMYFISTKCQKKITKYNLFFKSLYEMTVTIVIHRCLFHFVCSISGLTICVIYSSLVGHTKKV